MTTRAALRLLTGELALPGLTWGTAEVGEPIELAPEEAAAISRALPARRAEFMAGRLAARRAMARLGHAAHPVPAGTDRAPIWPAGICGSISHEGGLAVAVVARAPAAIGVDLALDTPLEDALIPEICRPEERALVPRFHQGHFAARAFSAKEALFKAQYPVTGVLFGFHGMEVHLDQGVARFTDDPEIAAIPQSARVEMPIAQRQRDGLILSLSARFL